MTINVPNVRVGSTDWSLAEIAISDDYGGVIEYGWLDAPSQYKGDRFPHLFLAVRSTNQSLCWISKNGDCGFHAAAGGHPVGDNASLQVTAQPQQFHIGHFDGSNAWWVEYNYQWIGFIDDTWFGNRPQGISTFRRATHLYWYGEVGSRTWQRPCGEMGSGNCGTQDGSALITDMQYEKFVGPQSTVVKAQAHVVPPDAPDASHAWNMGHLRGNTNAIRWTRL
jgi:hypothetical protein